MSLQDFGYKEQLHRALTTWDLIIYGMIFMLPIAPYAVFGLVWEASKGMVPLAYLVGLVGMFFTALSYAAMSRAFPLAGSVYTYAQRGLHETAGFFSGWLILLDYILVPSLLYLFSAVALRPIFPAVPAWLWLTGFISFNAIVNLLGIEFTARVNKYMLVMELSTLALFVGLGLHALYHGVGAGGLTLKPIYNPQVFSWSTVAGATSIAVLSFLGFDGISTLSEESRGNLNAIGRATVWSLLLVGALFMLQTWIAADLAAGHAFFLARHGVLRSGGKGRRAVAAPDHHFGHRDCPGDCERHGCAGGGIADTVCHGPRRQAACDTGQSPSPLSNTLCEHSRRRGGIAAGRTILRGSRR
jgi:amino acid transporter